MQHADVELVRPPINVLTPATMRDWAFRFRCSVGHWKQSSYGSVDSPSGGEVPIGFSIRGIEAAFNSVRHRRSAQAEAFIIVMTVAIANAARTAAKSRPMRTSPPGAHRWCKRPRPGKERRRRSPDGAIADEGSQHTPLDPTGLRRGGFFRDRRAIAQSRNDLALLTQAKDSDHCASIRHLMLPSKSQSCSTNFKLRRPSPLRSLALVLPLRMPLMMSSAVRLFAGKSASSFRAA